MASKLRIRAVTPPGEWVRPKGKDVNIFVVNDDGTETPIPGVFRVLWSGDTRGGHCVATIVAWADIDMPVSAEDTIMDEGFKAAMDRALKGDGE